MNKKEHISKLVEETLESADGAGRAEPRPFLLTRIHARMNRDSDSVWERTGWFITRPAVAFSGLCMIILVNVAVLLFNQGSVVTPGTEQVIQSPADEFSYSVATIYDTENTQP